MQHAEIDKQWFLDKLEERKESMRSLGRHLGKDGAAISRTLSGERKMQMKEAHSIARFLNAPVSEVVRHAWVENSSHVTINVTAEINEKGELQELREPKPLPQPLVDRAQAALSGSASGKIVAAQIIASKGFLAMWDDAVVFFEPTERVDNDAIGSLAICRTIDGSQLLGRVEKARKTGEATVRTAFGTTIDVTLQTAYPVITLIP